MTKEQFNQMEVLEQIEYINNNIADDSLTKFCDNMGINRSTITKRFKNIGYTFDKQQNKYCYSTDVQQVKNNNTTDTKQLNDSYITVEQFKALEQRIKALEEALGGSTNIQLTNNKDIRFYKNDTIVRAYRIDNEVYQRFKLFTEENKQYKLSDIISTALELFLEGME